MSSSCSRPWPMEGENSSLAQLIRRLCESPIYLTLQVFEWVEVANPEICHHAPAKFSGRHFGAAGGSDMAVKRKADPVKFAELGVSPKVLLRYYRDMLLIRRFE